MSDNKLYRLLISMVVAVVGTIFMANMAAADINYGYGSPQGASFSTAPFGSFTHVVQVNEFASPGTSYISPPYGAQKIAYAFDGYKYDCNYDCKYSCYDKYGYAHYSVSGCSYYSNYDYSPYRYGYKHYYDPCNDPCYNYRYTYDGSYYDTAYYHQEQHDHIIIESVVYDSAVYADNQVPIRVLVRNVGPYREQDIKVYLTVDGNIGKSVSFELGPYKHTTQTVYVKAPKLPGKYGLNVKVFNRYHSQEQNDYLYVYAYGSQLVPIDFVDPRYPQVPQQVIPSETIVTSTPENPITKVVVRDRQVTIEKPVIKKEEPKEKPEEKKIKFVDVDFSNKELDVKQKEGNILKVTVTNHLGEDALFGVRTSFDQSLVFVPDSEILKDGETKIFNLHFNPGEKEGRLQGAVEVLQNGATIRAQPLSIYMAPSTATKIEASAFGNLLPYALIFALIAILAIMLFSVSVVLF